MQLRPLGTAKDIINSTGLEITYAYDDLIFVEHSPFLIQFDDKTPTNLKLFFNTDCEAEAATRLESQLVKAAGTKDFTIQNCGKFKMKQKEGVEEIELEFLS